MVNYNLYNPLEGYNTICIENDSLVGKNTSDGAQQLSKTGKPLLQATKEQVLDIIRKRALDFNDEITGGRFSLHCISIDRLEKSIIQSTGLDIQDDLKDIDERMFLKFTEIIHNRVKSAKNLKHQKKEVDSDRVRREKLASDLARNLKINGEREFLSPLSDEEAAFIDQYLQNSPLYQKWKAHFEIIQKATDRLLDQPIGKLKEHVIDGKTYHTYDLDDEHYQFFGCAGDTNTCVDDYEGYAEGRWDYLCVSLVDERHPFYQEGRYKIFQILSIPPEAIMRTYQLDAFTPMDRDEQHPWYAAVRRSLVLTDRIMTAYNAMQEMRFEQEGVNVHHLSTPVDELQRIRQQIYSLTRLLKATHYPPEKARLISEVIELLNIGTASRNMDEIFFELEKANLLKEKDFKFLKELTYKHKEIIDKPEFGGWDFNRTVIAMKDLIDYYTELSPKLSRENKKEIFMKLFHTDDPTENYDIVGELKRLQALLKNMPPSVFFSTLKVERLLGPGELKSQTPHNEYNEINVNTQLGKGVAVKGWLIPKVALKKAEFIKVYLEVAEREGIPVFTRDFYPSPD